MSKVSFQRNRIVYSSDEENIDSDKETEETSKTNGNSTNESQFIAESQLIPITIEAVCGEDHVGEDLLIASEMTDGIIEAADDNLILEMVREPEGMENLALALSDAFEQDDIIPKSKEKKRKILKSKFKIIS